jgi:hypothetical protein
MLRLPYSYGQALTFLLRACHFVLAIRRLQNLFLQLITYSKPPPLAWGVPRIQRLPLAATSGRRLILILSPFAGLTYQIKNGPKIFFKWNAFWFFFFSPWYPMYHLKKVGNLFLFLVFLINYLFIFIANALHWLMHLG